MSSRLLQNWFELIVRLADTLKDGVSVFSSPFPLGFFFFLSSVDGARFHHKSLLHIKLLHFYYPEFLMVLLVWM